MKIKLVVTGLLVQSLLFSTAPGHAEKIKNVRQLTAWVFITNLNHQYDGQPKQVEVRTLPIGLSVRVTYNGSTTLPVDAGKYEVYAEVTDSRWRGSSSAEMIISPVSATITFGNIIQKYDGKQKKVAITTSPPGLKTKIAYAPNPPINAGSYRVTAEIDENNYFGSANTDLIIEKAQATIVFEKLVQLYDGKPKAAVIDTDPKGLKVTSTYNNSGSQPSKSGKYELKVVVNDPNYTGEKTGIFVINTAPVALAAPEIKVKEDAEPTEVDLSKIFKDPDEDDELRFSVTRNTNEQLFDEVSINKHLLKLSYRPNANGQSEITVRATDNYNALAESNIWVDVEPVNDPPLLEIDETIIRFVPVKDKPAPILDWVKITDPDDEFMTGAQIFFNPRAYERHVDLLLFEGTGNIKGNFSRDAGILNLIGIDTKENYENALKRVMYDNRSEGEFKENRILTIYIDDGKSSSNFVHKEIELASSFVSLNIPTGFTPNNDNVNNTWKIQNLENYPDATIQVFNRSGQMVFQSSEQQTEWDGTFDSKPAPAGSYYYIISVPSYEKVFTGHVTILR